MLTIIDEGNRGMCTTRALKQREKEQAKFEVEATLAMMGANSVLPKNEDEVRWLVNDSNPCKRRSWKSRSANKQPCKGFKAESSQFFESAFSKATSLNLSCAKIYNQ